MVQRDSAAKKSRLIRKIQKRLAAAYPVSNLGNKRNPLDELLYIILSLQTNEELYKRSYACFKRQFSSWEQVADSTVDQLEKTIRDSGLAAQKSRNLISIARKLRNDFGRVSLSSIKEMTTEDAESYLLSFPGVGLKTARCVLMYSMDRAVFPVDTHCARIMQRLGLIEGFGKRLEQIANEAQNVVPISIRKDFHVLLIQHGRKVCKSRPKCSACVLSEICPSAQLSASPITR